jgi:acyl carrier protein
MAELAKCFSLPPSEAALIERIRNFIAVALDCPVEQIGADDHLYETLNLDSLGAMAVSIDMSYEFGIPAPNSDLDFGRYHSARLLATYVRSFERGR